MEDKVMEILGANKLVCRYADNLCERLKSKNIDAGYTISVNDYGTSCYIILTPGGEKLKIRISDHSVQNRDRMIDEMHVNLDRNVDELVTSIDRLHNPNNYKFIQTKTGNYLCDGVRGIWVKGE